MEYDHDGAWAESLRYHLVGAARAAEELELAPIIRSLRRCQRLAPGERVAPERVPEPGAVVPTPPDLSDPQWRALRQIPKPNEGKTL